MVNERSFDDWREAVLRDAQQSVRDLTDWSADILTVLRLVTAAGVAGLMGVGTVDGETYMQAEHLHAALFSHQPYRYANTNLTTKTVVMDWMDVARSDRDKVLVALADEFARMLYVLNLVSAGDGLARLASDREGYPYHYAQRAHVAVLTLLTGSAVDGRRVHELWSSNSEDTAWNLAVVADEKRAASVVVTVAADGNGATVALPGDPTDYLVTRKAWDSALFEVRDEVGDVVGTALEFAALGTALAGHYRLKADVRVIVEKAKGHKEGE